MTHTATRSRQQQDIAHSQGGALVVAEPRLQMPAEVADYDVDKAKWRVLVEAIFPAAKSSEAVLMALAYCHSRGLDVFKKPVHVVPVWSTQAGRMVESVWPGIAEIRTTAARTGSYAGADAVVLGPMKKRTFEGKDRDGHIIQKTVEFPEFATMTVYRLVHGSKCPFTATVYWEETFATLGKMDVPNDMWARRPRGQISKCVEAAALRMAFPEELGSTYAAEEMEGRIVDGDVQVAAPPMPTPPPADDPTPKSDAVEAEFTEAKDDKPVAPSGEFEKHCDAFKVAVAKCGSEIELTAVWKAQPGALYKSFTAQQQQELKDIAASRKAEISSKTADAQTFDLNSAVEAFKAASEKVMGYGQLDQIWIELVQAPQEAGKFSSNDMESRFAPIYDAARVRIDDMFPMDRVD